MPPNDPVSAPPSPATAPSDASAPLFLAEDLHSISSSDEAASDWSSPSDASDLGAEDEEDEASFDLLASQELRQLPSDSSASSDARRPNLSSRMTLSFPDPINTASPATDSDGEARPSRVGATSAPPLSPAPSSGKVQADLDNSILVDGGSYSLLLDAPSPMTKGATSPIEPPTSASVPSSPEPETTSTPPPSSAQRPGFLRSHPSISSGAIVRVERSSSTSIADDKVDKWRSTLLATSALATPSPRQPIALSNSDDDLTTGDQSTVDLSSVNSSQTVRASSASPLATPLNRSLVSARSSQSPLVDTVAHPTGEKENRKNPHGPTQGESELSSIPSKLDRIIAQPPDHQPRSNESRSTAIIPWWNRIMIALTITGVALAGIGVTTRCGSLQQLAGFAVPAKDGGNAPSVTPTVSFSPQPERTTFSQEQVQDGEEERRLGTNKLVSPLSSSSVYPSRVSLSNDHNADPIALTPSHSPSALAGVASDKGVLPSRGEEEIIADAETSGLTSLSSSSSSSRPPLDEPPRLIYTIDPPFSIAPVLANPVPMPDGDEVEEAVRADQGGGRGGGGDGRGSSHGVRGRIVARAMAKRDETLNVLSEYIQREQGSHSSHVGAACRGAVRTVKRHFARHDRLSRRHVRHRRGSRHLEEKIEAIVRNSAVGGGFDRDRQQVAFGSRHNHDDEEDGGAVDKDEDGDQRGELSRSLKDAWTFVQTWERRLEREIKLAFRGSEHPNDDDDDDAHDERTVVAQGPLVRVRLDRYPVVRDYYERTKELVQDRLSHHHEGRDSYDRAARTLKRVWRDQSTVVEDRFARARARAVAGLVHAQAELKSRIIVRDGMIDRARRRVGFGGVGVGVGSNKQWRDVLKAGERHVKRAAKAVKKMEKRDRWQARRDEKKDQRQRRKKRG